MGLLRCRRFLPLFLTQFLGAFNDNLLKNALVMLITYRLSVDAHTSAQMLVTLAAGLFILPYLLFSATAGQLADKMERSFLVRAIKLTEIGIMVLATLGFLLENTYFLLFVLFAMGTHSTFFGPIKYALLPQHLQPKELLLGNAYIESGSFLAILLGTIGGGLLILQESGTVIVSAAMILIAVAGYCASRYIPAAPAPMPHLAVDLRIWRETLRLMRYSIREKRIFYAILGISWFWLIGATFLSQFPAFAKDVLHADETVVTLFLAVFSIGIGIGSLLCNLLLRGRITSRYVPLAALGISVFTFDLYGASGTAFGHATPLMGYMEFLLHRQGAHILIDLLMVSVCAGLYIVPLYAILQHDGDVQFHARIVAANNIWNALFMIAAAMATLAMLAASFTIPEVFLALGLLNAGMAAWLYMQAPGRNF